MFYQVYSTFQKLIPKWHYTWMFADYLKEYEALLKLTNNNLVNKWMTEINA